MITYFYRPVKDDLLNMSNERATHRVHPVFAWDKVISLLITKTILIILSVMNGCSTKILKKDSELAYRNHSAWCVVFILSHQFASPPEGDGSATIN